MEFADYGGMYATDDSDHHIDLRNPHFRQEAYMHMHHPHQHPQSQHDFYSHHMQHPHFSQHLASLTVDVKPRLTKEQHDILENHYQGQNKPNTQTKKGFAEALGVSLDKVNNWFQNRRAKSKQDAKKAASQYTMDGQQTQQGGQSAVASSASSQTDVGADDISAQFLNSDCLSSPNPDSAISIDPMSLSNGLGITRDDAADQPPTTMSPQDMMTTKHAELIPDNLKIEPSDDMDLHRRTLTQEQFDSFANASEYVTGRQISSGIHESPKHESELFDSYLNDMSTFGASLDSNDMQTDSAADNFGSSSSLFPDVTSAANDIPRNPSVHSSVSDWSEHSTPSLSVTPVEHHADSGYAASDHDLDISPRGKSISSNSAQWQPGQSVPCDFEAMEREFKEIAARNNSNSTSSDMTRRNSSIPFAERQFAFANEQPFTQSEAPASLTQSMNNMGLSNDATPRGHSVSSISGNTIAARRQRPRPQPLINTSSAMRSASYCGPLPTAPGVMNPSAMPPTAPTLRRIKSSNVMNGGIASGRIQKSVSGAQRSPLNFTFAEAMNSPKFTRRTSSYSPANGGLGMGGGNLAPPTPLSPTELSHRLELQRQSSQIFGARQLSRQPSINELQEESHQQMLSTNNNPFSSPPTTPNYPVQYGRNRLANGMLAENTPPQSAPASQQCFPSSIYSQPTQMPTSYAQAPMMTTQASSYAPVMQTMQNVVMPSRPLQAGQYLEMLQAQQQMNNMSQMLPGSQQMQINYANMGFGVNSQTMYANNVPFSYVPAATPGVLMPQQQQHSVHHGQSKSVPGADFFVHEYSPPQDVKRVVTPRKSHESGPKNYTFANHGPEHFEKTKKDLSASPGSSSGTSSS
ncbi:hypothetical protein K461DRAFT_293361 [Myriangium duriaei CBS 260.36]|uniref:Homeobox domain-containing protein n=1 Tax=Myriangium duriaei CBS 260.36 TaxID=1168546 RepID=A0A9P4J059_9PEZI|nr:hypothetical protein K461DRAFT_293361 [Myriangium duriaei CBS 260.36]